MNVRASEAVPLDLKRVFRQRNDYTTAWHDAKVLLRQSLDCPASRA